MFKITVNFFDQLMKEYTPDPFLLALILSTIVMISGVFFTDSTPTTLILAWGDSFWSLITFTMQMMFILIGGYVVAVSSFVTNTLRRVIKNINSNTRAIVITTIVTMIASTINWGLGLVISGIICKELRKVFPQVNYRLLVASAYSGFIVWHGGFSASIPLSLATKENFTYERLQALIPIQETLLSNLNLIAMIGCFILLPIVNFFINKSSEKNYVPAPAESLNDDIQEKIIKPEPSSSIAMKLENSKIISWMLAIIGISYVILLSSKKTFTFDLNIVNFMFLFLGIILHKTPRAFIKVMGEATGKAAPILLQFPFYAGIMGMIQASGLAEKIISLFVKIATPETFSFFAFISAGLLNLFVPSGGGQWAIQGDITIQAAQNIGANINNAITAVSWGDAWTNLLQPFWALPVLAIAGLQVRDIMGYCVIILLVSGVFLSSIFLLFG